MNFLDIRTVLISQVISNSICAIVIWVLWRQNRTRAPEIGFWLADFIMQFAAILLIVLRGSIPNFFSIVVANAFVIGGTILLFIGLEKYTGKKGSQLHNYIYLGLFIIIHSYFTYVDNNLLARNINGSVALLIICFQIAWLMFHRVEPEKRQYFTQTGFVFTIYCIVIFTRIIMDLIIPHTNDLFTSGLFDTLAILMYQMLFIGLTFSLFLMVNRRLFRELEQDIIFRKAAQEALKTSEEKFSSAFQNSPDAIILSSLEDGQIIEANASFFRLSEYSWLECENKTTIDLNIWENAVDRERYVEKLKQDNRVTNFVSRFRKKSGVLFHCLISSEIVSIKYSKYVISVIHDLSEKEVTDKLIKDLSRFPEENPNPVMRFDISGKILYANPASRYILDQWQELNPDSVPVFWGNAINEVSTLQKPVEIVEDFNHRIFSFLLSTSTKSEHINAYGRDITDRVKATHALEIERNKLKSILDGMNDGVYIVNQDYEIEYVNPALTREFGHPGEKKCYEYFNDLENPCVWCKNREVFEGNSIQWEWVSPKDGKTFSIFETPVNNPDGTMSKMEVFHDMTKFKKAEIELRDSENRFRAIFEQAAVGVAQLNTMTGEFIQANRKYCEITGLDPDRIDKSTFMDITFPEDIQENKDRLQNLISGEMRSFSIEKRYLHPDGKIIWANLTASAMWQPGENPNYHIAVIEDITNRKNIELKILELNENLENMVEERTLQLVATNKELEAFSYSVSHDLRAPLRALDGFSLALLEDYGSNLDTTGKGYLNRIRSASRRMADLIDAMLKLAQVTKAEVKYSKVNLSQLAKDIADEISNHDVHRKISWKIDPDLVVLADSTLIKNAMENLLENAWKFTSKHAAGTIEVGKLTKNGTDIYFVKDDGAGFDMHYASKLFGAFQRMHPINEFNGTGIGLATVKRIINKHGGEIWAEGQPEAGATFYFTLSENKEHNVSKENNAY